MTADAPQDLDAARTVLPAWVKAGKTVVVASSTNDGGTAVYRLTISKVLKRDLVMVRRDRADERVYLNTFTDDGMGGHFHHRKSHGNWHFTTLEVFHTSHPRAEALVASAEADNRLSALAREVEDLRAARQALRRRRGVLHPTDESEHLADRVAALSTKATIVAAAITKALATSRELTRLQSLTPEELATEMTERTTK